MLAAGSLVAQAKPLKIYILAGQSNMTGMARNHTLEHIKMSPDPAKEFAAMFDAEGNPVEIDQVRVSCWPKRGEEQMGVLKPGYGGGSDAGMFGPEYGFGVYMHQKLWEPFLIIKCAQGGRDLNFNFRPPGAGEWAPPAGHPDVEKPGKTKTVVADPKMPAVIGVMGIGGIQKDTNIGRFQEAQTAIAEKPEFKSNVAALHTGKFWNHELAALSSRAGAIKRANSKKGNKRKADPNLDLTPLAPEEQNILKVGVSDADFHYMGSGKIMTAIGKGFAESTLKLGEQAK